MSAIPKVTVVMPVFNAEKFVGECLDSILRQTIKDVEVVCVDDGSTDNSAAVVEEYARKDSRVHLFRQANKGPGPARNLGLDNATGEFVSFMDPDDRYHDETVLKMLYDAAHKYDCPIAGGSMLIFGGEKKQAENANKVWAQQNGYPKLGVLPFSEYHVPFGYTRYIFTRSIIEAKKIRFPALRRYQDPPFCFDALAASGRIWVCDYPVYDYRISHKITDWFADDCCKARHVLQGTRMLMERASEHGLKDLFVLLAKRLEKIFPANVYDQPVVKKEFAQCASLINKTKLLSLSERRELLAQIGHGLKLSVLNRLKLATGERGLFFVAVRSFEGVLFKLHLLPKERELFEVAQKLSAKEVELRNIHNRCTKAEAARKKTDAELAKIKTQFAKSESERKKAETALVGVKAECAKTDEARKKAEAEVAKLKTDFAGVDAARVKAETELEKTKAEADRIDAERKKAAETIEQVKRANADGEARLGKANGEIAKLKKANDVQRERMKHEMWAIDTIFESARDAAMARPMQQQTLCKEAMSGTGYFRMVYDIVPAVFGHLSVLRDEAEIGEKLDYSFLWGNGHNLDNACALGAALKYDALLVLCEDGFLRSADTWANFKAPDKYRFGCSLIFDTRACYYDATAVSTIELMLNDPALKVTDEQKAEARRLIDKIVSNKLTKYNHQPIYSPEVGRPGHRKVLVVDQSYGDFAIKKGWADDSTFENMLEAAIRENPDADILVKTHPDTMTGTRKGYYDSLKEHGNVFRVTMPINPYSLMDVVDKVYVCSTQFGFEALMAGKEVHVFGMPFYAGWGMTIDAQKNPRRTNKRTLEEIVSTFSVLYTHWSNPETGKACTIDESIDYLIRLRDEYREFMKGSAT